MLHKLHFCISVYSTRFSLLSKFLAAKHNKKGLNWNVSCWFKPKVQQKGKSFGFATKHGIDNAIFFCFTRRYVCVIKKTKRGNFCVINE